MTTVRRLVGSVPADVWFALGLVVLLRVVLSALGIVLWLEGDLPGPCHFELARNGWTEIPPLAGGPLELPLVGIWQRWDACWYSKIATFGYTADGSTAFLPLLPGAMRAGGVLLGGNVALAGLVVSAVAMVVALVGLQRLVTDDLGRPIARRTAWLVIAWPAALYWLAPFTEALFLATSVWAFRFARQDRWLAAGTAAALAVATRLPGVLLVVPLAWEAARWAWDRRQAGNLRIADLVAAGLAVAAPLLALGAVVLYQQGVTGTNLFEAQDGWGGREFHPPWETVGAAWDWVLNGSTLRGVELVNLAALVLCGGLVLTGIRRLPASYVLYGLAVVLLLAARIQPVPLTSTIRYLGVAFPALVAAALLLRRPNAERAWLVASASLLGLLTVLFLRGSFVA
ncbi:MAG: hypothetical protein MUC54_03575 [Chloroflexi bacterium]|nr:hypothetical protein [Chloroflexota bacterium]